jgi:hypothetical protein
MSMIFYPGGWELAVDNPGYGELNVRALTHPYDAEPLVEQEWSREFHGPKVGQFLAAVTAKALGGTPGKVGYEELPPFVTAEVARQLLPALQSATLLALAGSDRYERTFPEDRDHYPWAPLCVRCNLGSDYTSVPTTSEWCEQYGHTPFGTPLSQWESAQEAYQLELDRWKRAEARRRQDEAPAVGTPRQAIDLDTERRARRGPGADR